MNELKMYTQEEVAELFHVHVTRISELREIGILPAIKTGRNFMFSFSAIKQFEENYQGLDVSNRVKAIEAYRLVQARLGVSEYAYS